jgi:hypothetical protein
MAHAAGLADEGRLSSGHDSIVAEESSEAAPVVS